MTRFSRIRRYAESAYLWHFWGFDSKSPCGRDVATAYSVPGHGYSSDWADVTCTDCLARRGDRK